MSDLDPMMVLTFAHTQMVGEGSMSMDANVKPTPGQYALKDGDKAMALTSSSVPMEDAGIMVEVMDPQPEHQKEFVRWQDRIAMGFVLCRYWTTDDRLSVDHVGWFARVKLVPLTDEEWAETFEWAKLSENLSEMSSHDEPEWLGAKVTEIQDQLSQHSENIIKPMQCGNCGGRDVQFHLKVNEAYAFRAGIVIRDGDQTIVPQGKYSMDRETGYHLHCENCKAKYDDFGEGTYKYEFPGLDLHDYEDKEIDPR